MQFKTYLFLICREQLSHYHHNHFSVNTCIHGAAYQIVSLNNFSPVYVYRPADKTALADVMLSGDVILSVGFFCFGS